METKICSDCKKDMPLTMYEINKQGTKEYYRNKCCECRLIETQMCRNRKKLVEKIQITNKICSHCNENKDVSEFNKLLVSSDGYNKLCRACVKITRRKNKLEINSNITEIWCILCNTIKSSTNFKTNKRSKTGYFKTCNDCWKPIEWNNDKQLMAGKKYALNNRDKLKQKWKNDSKKINRIIRKRLNCRIKDALFSMHSTKIHKTNKYIGCDINYMKKWFEFHFKDGIGWHNFREWHIDHVIPCSNFDLSKDEDQYKCFNWKNLRPCMANENIKKGNKIIVEVCEKQQQMISEFLIINPLPTLPGDRVEGTE